jgi:cystathionine beta-lyase/cystathionine gamma-synthase
MTPSARKLVVDNVFATPLCSRSRSNSAPHVVVYSATKHIDGQGRVPRRHRAVRRRSL